MNERLLSLEHSEGTALPVIDKRNLCSVCSLTINSEGDLTEQRCFIHKIRPPLKTKLGGSDLPLVGDRYDHRIHVETTPDILTELYVTSGMIKGFQEWHDNQAPIHPLCSNCDINRSFLVGFGRR